MFFVVFFCCWRLKRRAAASTDRHHHVNASQSESSHAILIAPTTTTTTSTTTTTTTARNRERPQQQQQHQRHFKAKRRRIRSIESFRCYRFAESKKKQNEEYSTLRAAAAAAAAAAGGRQFCGRLVIRLGHLDVSTTSFYQPHQPQTKKRSKKNRFLPKKIRPQTVGFTPVFFFVLLPRRVGGTKRSIYRFLPLKEKKILGFFFVPDIERITTRDAPKKKKKKRKEKDTIPRERYKIDGFFFLFYFCFYFYFYFFLFFLGWGSFPLPPNQREEEEGGGPPSYRFFFLLSVKIWRTLSSSSSPLLLLLLLLLLWAYFFLVPGLLIGRTHLAVKNRLGPFSLFQLFSVEISTFYPKIVRGICGILFFFKIFLLIPTFFSGLVFDFRIKTKEKWPRFFFEPSKNVQLFSLFFKK